MPADLQRATSLAALTLDTTPEQLALARELLPLAQASPCLITFYGCAERLREFDLNREHVAAYVRELLDLPPAYPEPAPTADGSPRVTDHDLLDYLGREFPTLQMVADHFDIPVWYTQGRLTHLIHRRHLAIAFDANKDEHYYCTERNAQAEADSPPPVSPQPVSPPCKEGLGEDAEDRVPADATDPPAPEPITDADLIAMIEETPDIDTRQLAYVFGRTIGYLNTRLGSLAAKGLIRRDHLYHWHLANGQTHGTPPEDKAATDSPSTPVAAACCGGEGWEREPGGEGGDTVATPAPPATDPNVLAYIADHHPTKAEVAQHFHIAEHYAKSILNRLARGQKIVLQDKRYTILKPVADVAADSPLPAKRGRGAGGEGSVAVAVPPTPPDCNPEPVEGQLPTSPPQAFTAVEYANRLGISEAQANRDLGAMIISGALRRVGNRYEPVAALPELPARPAMDVLETGLESKLLAIYQAAKGHVPMTCSELGTAAGRKHGGQGVFNLAKGLCRSYLLVGTRDGDTWTFTRRVNYPLGRRSRGCLQDLIALCCCLKPQTAEHVRNTIGARCTTDAFHKEWQRMIDAGELLATSLTQRKYLSRVWPAPDENDD